MRFDDVETAVHAPGFMTPWQGRQVYDHIRSEGARNVLEIGTAFGLSACYMGAAVDANGGGTVLTVDRYQFAEPTPEEVVAKTGLGDTVEIARTEHSSYCWWLKERIETRSDEHGNCEPEFDFCYLDGSHEWHMDGLAVVLIERLLRPGGWLLMDDLHWRWADTSNEPPPNLSQTELRSPPLRAVWDVVLRQHPGFDTFRLQDDGWGWAAQGDVDAPVHRDAHDRHVRHPPAAAGACGASCPSSGLPSDVT